MCDIKHNEDLKAVVGKISSHAFNAEVNAAKAASIAESVERLLYQWHAEDIARSDAMDKRVSGLEGMKSKLVGIGIGIGLLLTFIFNLIMWGLPYAWDSLTAAL